MEIVLDKLTRTFGAQRAVDDVSFKAGVGITGFLGPNGAGKSTTMRMITGFLEPTSGSILIDGKPAWPTNPSHRSMIGYLPEHNPLYTQMYIREYLTFIAGIHKLKHPKQAIERVVELVGLAPEIGKQIGALSKGYRQRVGLAQAMIHDPEVLILDEPTTGLDPNQIVEIRELIRKLGREKTVILSTHILPEVEATCDRILIINKGKIVADGTANTLRKQAQGQQVLRLKIDDGDANEIYEALTDLSTVALVDFVDQASNRFEVQSHQDLMSNKTIFQLCVKRNWTLTELIPFETKLEDIFRDLTLN